MIQEALLVLGTYVSLGACISSASPQGLWETTIRTNSGPVRGVQAFPTKPAFNISSWQDITVWKGIPYGASTAYENRFKAPQPPKPWTGVRNADKFGDICPVDPNQEAGYPISEDCLNLNIWTAGSSITAKLPVVLWSYPDGASASQPRFDGAKMASRGLVFVNYNYRAAAFAYLVHPELHEERLRESGHNSSGNYRMLDQYAALKWVHENIANFGGDPSKITVAGESGGSAAVYHLVNGPFSKGMISGAISESGIRDPYDPMCATLAENYKDLDYRLEEGKDFLKDRIASSIKDLRALKMEDLLVPLSFGPKGKPKDPGNGKGGKGKGMGGKGMGGKGPPAFKNLPSSSRAWQFGTTLDYFAIPDKYIDTLKKGPANDVPLITGNNKDESGVLPDGQNSPEEYKSEMEALFGKLAPRFFELYPGRNSSEASLSYNSYYRDANRVSSWLYGNKWAKSAKAPFYSYYWDHAPPGTTQAGHMSEIVYALGNLHTQNLSYTAEDYAVEEKLNSYWVNFAKTGNPNTGDAYKDGTLEQWHPSVESKEMTHNVGNSWGNVPIAEPAKVQFISDFFASQKPF
ncbi:alpha/beta-hydrolase [Microthyrium microscopicum]|uniref:Carboxylic ester hydrolase n=1 Tax=Microthyrium microscopicum TaxID=703497 RepID=A0A6A6U5B1_9PEZI|nr:alpha/beta-hydrolase [Microthyrium microscopicum]